ncbi:hypothetical protein ACFE04_010675 [Oxalis oulophora]
MFSQYLRGIINSLSLTYSPIHDEHKASDYYHFDDLLTPEERAIRIKVRNCMEKIVAPIMTKVETDREAGTFKANSDLANSDALQMAGMVDLNGNGTIRVVTKCKFATIIYGVLFGSSGPDYGYGGEHGDNDMFHKDRVDKIDGPVDMAEYRSLDRDDDAELRKKVGGWSSRGQIYIRSMEL